MFPDLNKTTECYYYL